MRLISFAISRFFLAWIQINIVIACQLEIGWVSFFFFFHLVKNRCLHDIIRIHLI